MKTLILGAGLAVMLPLSAEARMLRSECGGALEKLAQMLPGDVQPILDVARQPRVTPDGWCQLTADDLQLQNDEFDVLEWRAEGIERWNNDGIPPLALHLRVEGLDPDEMQELDVVTSRPDIDAEMTWRQDPDAGLLLLERAYFDNGAGDTLLVSAVFERVYLSSTSMMQISIGSATFKAGLMSVTLAGVHENPFAAEFEFSIAGEDRAQAEGAFDLISDLPDGVIDDASRAELTAYARDYPNPTGTLEMGIASERGLGLMQIGMSLYQTIEAVMDDDARANQLDILLDGITITADWTPVAQNAD